MAHVGVSDQERDNAQEIVIDIIVFLDLEAAANTDDMQLTVDYQWVVDEVQKTVQQNRFQLLETLVCSVCRRILEHGRVASVQVTARKFPQVLRGRATHVEVEMKRSN